MFPPSISVRALDPLESQSFSRGWWIWTELWFPIDIYVPWAYAQSSSHGTCALLGPTSVRCVTGVGGWLVYSFLFRLASTIHPYRELGIKTIDPRWESTWIKIHSFCGLGINTCMDPAPIPTHSIYSALLWVHRMRFIFTVEHPGKVLDLCKGNEIIIIIIYC